MPVSQWSTEEYHGGHREVSFAKISSLFGPSVVLRILHAPLNLQRAVVAGKQVTLRSMDHPIILFDGVCNLCNKSVQFIIKRDKKGLFRLASLQGNAGQALLQQYNLPNDTLYSFVLIENGKVYTRSTAALRVLRKLGGGWKLLYGLVILPPFIRNAIYNWIARNRYKWYGKREECMVPTPELKSRFLD
jgi:predicted DCC family thiol-disulfide oxidoreductase YuxK